MSQTTDEQAEIDAIFQDIPGGQTIRITRKEPEWAEGFLEDRHYDADNPITVSQLKNKWGGQSFQLNVLGDKGKFKKQKTIRINDVPKVDYQPIARDFATSGQLHQPAVPGAPMGHPQPAPPSDAMGQLQQVATLAQMMGWTAPGQAQQANQGQSAIDMQQQKMLFDMMQQQNQAQMDMRRADEEARRDQERWRREQAEAMKPKEPLNDVKHTITLLRELNGMKGEFGGDTNPTAEIINNTAPIVENAVSELLSLQKLKLQAELARIGSEQHNAPPLEARPAQVQPRQVAPTPAPPQIGGGNGSTDPVALAHDMGRIYRGLPESQQQDVLNAFLGTLEAEEEPDEINGEETENDENVKKENKSIDDSSEQEHNNHNIIDNPAILDPDDQAVLYGGSDEPTDQDVQDGEHARPVSPND